MVQYQRINLSVQLRNHLVKLLIPSGQNQGTIDKICEVSNNLSGLQIIKCLLFHKAENYFANWDKQKLFMFHTLILIFQFHQLKENERF